MSNPFEVSMAWWKEISARPRNKHLKIYYSADAYLKTYALVDDHNQEIGWNMVIKPYRDGYKVYDIIVYPQNPDPVYISVDVDKQYALWKANLTDEQDANLFGHGHSHVNMSVFPSGVDVRQQHDELKSKGNGFWLFQIWNKRGEITSFFYDLDKDLYYMPNEIEMIVEASGEPVESFLMNSHAMIIKPAKEAKEDEPLEVI